MSNPIDVATGAGRSIGTYFSLVSIVPSGVFVVGLTLLGASGAPSSKPDVSRLSAVLAGTSLSTIGAISVFTLVLGLVLHPLQFSLVQLYEGYWGTSRPAVELRTRWTRMHFERSRHLQNLMASAQEDGGTAAERARRRVFGDEAQRLDASYPGKAVHLMPTRLGNVLRRYELSAGRAYGLDAPQVLGHVALVADRSHVDYLNDQRSSLDLAVRLSFLMYLLSGLYAVALWPYGLWLLVSVAPYLFGYLSYRGAVVVAHHYGQAMAAVIDLNRFALYERLHLDAPVSTIVERQTNTRLLRVLAGFDDESLTYERAARGKSS